MKDTFYELYCEEVKKNDALKKELKHLKIENASLTRRINYLESHQEEIIDKKVKLQVDKVKTAFEDKIVGLEKKVAHLNSVLNNDSTNSGIPTSLTPLNKNKRIPNSREKSDKKKGGQINHEKHILKRFDESEITEYVDHIQKTCPNCGQAMIAQDECTIKDETDFQIVVKKIRHRFYETYCPNCGCTESVSIPNQLKEENQYGNGVQNLALTLLNEGFVSIKRSKEIISGLTKGEIVPSEGYISKLQKRLSNNLSEYINELKKEVIRLNVVHWDDTVININKNRSCLRFYGNEKIAYYASHMKKDKEGLDEDRILNCLDKETVVVHDHNKVNYNEEYEFLNAECCAHLLRDLKKVVDNLEHEWPKNMIELLLRENHNRSIGNYVDAEYMSIVYDQYVAEGYLENLEASGKYYGDTEKTLLKRLEEYKENYLMWTLNAEIPFTNNVSERSLRSSKTKMKVSGQFANIKNAEYFANIKSYLETGHRHGLNTTFLIERALNGNPVTIEEMKKHDIESGD